MSTPHLRRAFLMDLLSAFKLKKPAAPEAADSVRLARTRARQRLIGTAVLVVAGIVGFPLLFETEPRPISVDLPIEIPRKEGVAALTLPPAAPPSAVAESGAHPAPKIGTSGQSVITETAADAGREVNPAPASAPADATAAAPTSRKVATADQTPKSRAGASPQAGAAKAADAASADAARAKSLLEGRAVASSETPPATPGAPRFVVQVGAFTDPAAVRTTRAKVEHLGLPTYTQVAETTSGARTRVRVGPFATRAEAERAAARIKAADLPTVILVL